MSGISAIVLAGDRMGAKAIRHQNKAFLEFGGEPLVIHVLRAVQLATNVSGVVVVGPRERLEEVILSSRLQRKGEIIVVDQGQNLLENAKAGYVHALGMEYSPSVFHHLRQSEHADTPALFLSCDIPLITPWELDEIIELADLEKYDYSFGATEDTVMQAYYPGNGNPGIRMAYFHLDMGRYRHNNLHIAKPLKIHRLLFVEHMYMARHQKRLTDMFMILMTFLRVGRWTFRAIRLYLGLQIARFLYGRRFASWLYERVRSTNRLQSVNRCIGGIMDMKMAGVFTSYGGAVLDVDNARDLVIAEQMKDAWMKHQEDIYNKKRTQKVT